MRGYVAKLEDLTEQNTSFRKVLYTASRAQLVLMCLLPNEEIGQESHEGLDQFFRVESGTVKIVMDDQETVMTAGMAAVVPSGTKHNLTNVGPNNAKLYTLYTMPAHRSDAVHQTKADAQSAEGDHH